MATNRTSPIFLVTAVLYTESMNLHRIESSTEWHTITTSNQNKWQRTAATTHGIITIGNALTLLGLNLVIYGLYQLLAESSTFGIVLIFIGRLLDVVDGLAAHATGTKSFIGEVADATADKIGTFLTVIVIGLAGIAPWVILFCLIVPQALIPVIIYTQRRLGKTTHASLLGKLSMAGTWVVLAGFLINHIVQNDALLTAIYVMTCISISCATIATIGYLRNPSR